MHYLLCESIVGHHPMTKSRRYSELILLPTFEERYKYLKLSGSVGKETFGFDRYLNQEFYRSPEWRRFRRDMIVRDLGCDLGIEGREINKYAILHHLNPITADDIVSRSPSLMDPENVITTCESTHRAIHYGDESLLFLKLTERHSGDTSPWR